MKPINYLNSFRPNRLVQREPKKPPQYGDKITEGELSGILARFDPKKEQKQPVPKKPPEKITPKKEKPPEAVKKVTKKIKDRLRKAVGRPTEAMVKEVKDILKSKQAELKEFVKGRLEYGGKGRTWSAWNAEFCRDVLGKSPDRQKRRLYIKALQALIFGKMESDNPFTRLDGKLGPYTISVLSARPGMGGRISAAKFKNSEKAKSYATAVADLMKKKEQGTISKPKEVAQEEGEMITEGIKATTAAQVSQKKPKESPKQPPPIAKKRKEEGEAGKEINISFDDKAGSKEAIEEKDARVKGNLSTTLKYDLSKNSKVVYASLKNHLLQACQTAYQKGSDITYKMFENLPQGHVKTKYSTYKRLNKQWKEKWTEYKKVKKKLGPTKKSEFKRDIKEARKKRNEKIEEMYDMIEAKFSAHNERIEKFTNNHDLPSEFTLGSVTAKTELQKKIPAGVSINGVLKLITNKGRKRIFKNFGELVEGTYKEATDLFAVNKLAKDSPKKLLNTINAAILIRNIDKYLDKLGGINIFN